LCVFIKKKDCFDSNGGLLLAESFDACLISCIRYDMSHDKIGHVSYVTLPVISHDFILVWLNTNS